MVEMYLPRPKQMSVEEKRRVGEAKNPISLQQGLLYVRLYHHFNPLEVRFEAP